MEFLKDLLSLRPFSYDHEIRKSIFFDCALKSFEFHLNNCSEFKNWSIKCNVFGTSDIKVLEDLPFLPSNIFKFINLKSSRSVHKTLNSSGTTSHSRSKVFLDKENSRRQTIVLSKILSEILGKKRKPFIVIDLNPTLKSNGRELSARYAGLSGYLLASSKTEFVLKEDEHLISLDTSKFLNILEQYNEKEEPVVVIGYTYLIFEKLISLFVEKKEKIKLPEGSILIHFGGWKKLKEKKISKVSLNKLIGDTTNIPVNNVIDIYGFTEQLGSVYPGYGNNGCRVPSYSELIVRDTRTLKPVRDGEVGFLQFISPIQTSYPGLSIINDDIGKILSRENGIVEFEVLERPKNSVTRGCGDTLPEKFLFAKN